MKQPDVGVRGVKKVRTLVRWQALAHDMTRIIATPALLAAMPDRLKLAR